MAQVINPTTVTVVPSDGKLEITINLNLTVDGQMTASVEAQSVPKVAQDAPSEEKVEPMIPNFSSGIKLPFGKKV